MHTHILLWVEIDPSCQSEADTVNIESALEEEWGLAVVDQVTLKRTVLYSKELLNYCNGHIYALKNEANIREKMRIESHEDVEQRYFSLRFYLKSVLEPYQTTNGRKLLTNLYVNCIHQKLIQVLLQPGMYL